MDRSNVLGLDHVAITCRDVDATIEWYERVAGAELQYGDLWRAGSLPVAIIQIGASRLSLHRASSPASPHAVSPTPGSGDLCFRVGVDAAAILTALSVAEVEIVEGPVPRVSAVGERADSVYVRDPDGNLIEFLTTVGVER